jgi:hypothetical protein
MLTCGLAYDKIEIAKGVVNNMTNGQMQVLQLLQDIPEEKYGTIISFIEFIKSQREPLLLLEDDDEQEVLAILAADSWCSDEEMLALLEGSANA